MALFHAFLNWKRRIYYAHHYIAVGGACMNVDMYTKKTNMNIVCVLRLSDMPGELYKWEIVASNQWKNVRVNRIHWNHFQRSSKVIIWLKYVLYKPL